MDKFIILFVFLFLLSLSKCSSLNLCYYPPDKGSGSFKTIRYYYNPNIEDCETFIYNGSGGNSNNFIYLSDCRENCAGYVIR